MFKVNIELGWLISGFCSDLVGWLVDNWRLDRILGVMV